MPQCGCVRGRVGFLDNGADAAALVASDVSPSVRDVTKAAHRCCCVGSTIREVESSDT
jgi:hypothetical protein